MGDMKASLLLSVLLLLPMGLVLESQGRSLRAEQVAPTTNPTVSQPTVEVLSEGTGNKQILRFQPTVNHRQMTTMTVDQKTVMTMAGAELPQMVAPTVKITFETVVTKIAENGQIHYQFRYTGAEVFPQPGTPAVFVEAMRSQLKRLITISGSAIVDAQGSTRTLHYQLPPDLDAITRQLLEQMLQSAQQLSAPLPATAVGLGATWRVTTRPVVSGIHLKQTTLYELSQLQGSVASLTLTLEQQAPAQAMTLPGAVLEKPAQLKVLSTKGNGQTTIDLKYLAPLRSQVSIQSNSQIALPEAGAAQPMEMRTQTSMQVRLESQ